jgi:hypothetical protein
MSIINQFLKARFIEVVTNLVKVKGETECKNYNNYINFVIYFI